MGKFINLTGIRFGYLIVEKFVERKNGNTWWKCKCDCGKQTITTTCRLRNGETKSCGCYGRSGLARIKYSEDEIRLHRIYRRMINRCYNKKSTSYLNYGKRGIVVCNDWLKNRNNFVKWALENGYDNSLSIDRIDNNGNYEPKNCRWATRKEQNNNTRKNVFLNFNGQTKTIAQWAEILNITPEALRSRLKKMSVENALTTKRMRKKK